MMKILVLICTIDGGVCRVPSVLLPTQQEVAYVVSWQQSGAALQTDTQRAADELSARQDVTLSTLYGRGLSRNRNHAIDTALSLLCNPLEDAIFVMADDDERLQPEAFERLRDIFQRYPRMDAALLRVRNVANYQLLKPYPATIVAYGHHPRSYYPSSVEMVFRTRVWQMGLRFDERFGLGSPELCAGEEDILLTNMQRKGLRILIVPEDLCQTNPSTTGSHVLDARVLRSKGAVYGYQLSFIGALLRSLREALGLSRRHRVSPLPIFCELYKGLKYIRL